MQKFFVIVVVFSLCMGLSSCGQGETSSVVLSENSVQNSKSGVTIGIGMPKKDVEKLLGKGIQKDYSINDFTEESGLKYNSNTEVLFPHMFYGEGAERLILTYDENNLVKGISTGLPLKDFNEDVSNWQTKCGLSNGAALKDVLQHYGENILLENEMMSYKYLLFVYDPDGNCVNDVIDPKASYVVTFITNEKAEKVTFIAIGLI